MKPFRIAYVINSVEGGGAALPVPAVAETLRRHGAEVAIFALTRRDGRAIAPMEAAGFAVTVRDGGERDHVAALRWLDGQVAEWRPDVIWTSLTRATLLGQLVGWMRRKIVVSWQHAAFLKPANLRLLQATNRLSHVWIGDSETITRLTADRLGIGPDRLMTWPIFRADAEAATAQPWRPGEPVRIGSLGRLHPVKGYDMLIEALRRLPDGTASWELAIAGDGAEKAALEAAIAGAGLSGRVTLAGYVDPAAFLADLHLYVQPSRSEGLCIAAHEALVARVPVIASSVGELPRAIDLGIGRLVPPGDAAALSEAIAALLARPHDLAEMGTRARDKMLARYGADRFEAAGKAVLDRIRA